MPKVNYRPFGVLRTVLALMVLAQHVRELGPASWHAPLPLGTTAVLAFFALSGFVITEAAEQIYPGRPVAFGINRALRIVPQFLVALCLSVGAHILALKLAPALFGGRLVSATPAEAFSAANLARNFVDYLPATSAPYPFIPYAWALKIEVVFYAALAGSLLLGGRARRWGLGAVAAVGFAIFVAEPTHDLLKYSPLFALGAVAYWTTRAPKPWLWAALCGCFAASLWVDFRFVLAEHGDASAGFRAAYTALLAAILLTTFRLSRAQVSQRLARLDRRIGDLSYPLYLQQFGVLVAAAALLPPGPGAVAFASLLAVGTAWASDRILERPLAKLRDRFRGRTLTVGEGPGTASATVTSAQRPSPLAPGLSPERPH